MRISDWSSDVCSSDLTNMLLVPAIIQYLVDAQACTTTDWSSVRSLIYGAAPISDSLLRKAMRALQCDFIQIYGMTEHCGCAALLQIGSASCRARVCQYV